MRGPALNASTVHASCAHGTGRGGGGSRNGGGGGGTTGVQQRLVMHAQGVCTYKTLKRMKVLMRTNEMKKKATR